MNTKSTIQTARNTTYAIVPSLLSVRKIKAIVVRIIEQINRMNTVLEERRQLSRFSPKMLADIGLDAEAARQEYVRRYFDLPGGRW